MLGKVVTGFALVAWSNLCVVVAYRAGGAGKLTDTAVVLIYSFSLLCVAGLCRWPAGFTHTIRRGD